MWYFYILGQGVKYIRQSITWKVCQFFLLQGMLTYIAAP